MSADPERTIRVWDPIVRICHWTLVTTVLGAWITHEGPAALHEGLGYLMLVVVGLRLVWGFVGSEHARFADFVRSPATTMTYARQVMARSEVRQIGHNPLGAWMIVLLLATSLGAGLSGWLMLTDAYWGVAWVETLHELLADLILILAIVHVGGVIVTSRRQQESLIAAMVTGRKRAR